MFTLQGIAALSAVFSAGVLSHIVLFNRGEWDVAAMKLCVFVLSTQVLGSAGLLHYFPQEYDSPSTAAKSIGAITTSWILGIFTSILVYRAFFHRLNSFPGPYLARLSNLYPTSLETKRLQLYKEVQNLHQKYGDFVRLGPSELSINDPRAVAAIHGPQSKCVKGPWYNVLHPAVSLQMIRNKPDHIRRRKVWDRGFSAKALRDYEPRVEKYTNQLLTHLEKTKGTPVDATTWFNFYSFDVMGDMAFGKSFNMLRDGVKHYFMKTLHDNMKNIGLFSHMLYLFPIFKNTPILNWEYKRNEAWIKDQVEERKKMKIDVPDVFSWILEEYNARGKPTHQDELNLRGDAGLITVAGSDTTAATLTCLFYELSLQPRCLQALQSEVDELFNSNRDVDAISLAKLPYLEAVINETLRMHPPVPGGVQRMTPPEGIQVGETFIPGDSIVQIPSHTLYRDERVFKKPDEWIPERWTTRKELTVDASVFTPFSVGRYSCVGKQLALMEVRNVTANIVRRYNVKLAPGQTTEAFLDGKKDTFTLTLGPLGLVFDDRKT